MDTELGSSHKNMEKLSSHPLLQQRPRFVSSFNEFEVFLKITLDDLSAKITTLKSQKKILRQNRKAKNYLSCQIYMLKKYVQRVERFKIEIETRLDEVLQQTNNENNQGNVQESALNSGVNISRGKDEPLRDTFAESAIDCGDLESDKAPQPDSLYSNHHKKSGDSLGISVSSESEYGDSLKFDQNSTFDSITSLECDVVSDSNKFDSIEKHLELENYEGDNNNGSSNHVNVRGSIDSELEILLADMKKMKRRCKHVLDVTDKYCVLNNETDLKLNVQQQDVAEFNASLSKSPDTSRWSTSSSRSCSPRSEPVSPSNIEIESVSEDDVDGPKRPSNSVPNIQLPSTFNERGLIKMTLDSVGGHLGVLIKTYTRRHS